MSIWREARDDLSRQFERELFYGNVNCDESCGPVYKADDLEDVPWDPNKAFVRSSQPAEYEITYSYFPIKIDGSLMPKPNQIMPAGSAERKDVPLASGVLDYFPNALAEVARLSKVGNDKHNPGEDLHWSRGKSTDHADTILRHLVDRGTIDPEDGILHSVKVAWRALALLEEELLTDWDATPGRNARETASPNVVEDREARKLALAYPRVGDETFGRSH